MLLKLKSKVTPMYVPGFFVSRVLLVFFNVSFTEKFLPTGEEYYYKKPKAWRMWAGLTVERLEGNF